MSGFIYFAKCADQIKIGHATDVARRLAHLATGNPFPIHLIAAVPGSQALERAIHKTVGHLRLSGEWFQDHADIHGLIAELQTRGAGELECQETERRCKPALPLRWKRVIASLRSLFPEKAAYHLSALTGLKPRACFHFMSGRSVLSGDTFVALLQSSHGGDALVALMHDSTEPWIIALKRSRAQAQVAAVDRQIAEIRGGK